MRKPLEMRGWAVKHTAPDGRVMLVQFTRTRAEARQARIDVLHALDSVEYRMTVVPVVVRERR